MANRTFRVLISRPWKVNGSPMYPHMEGPQALALMERLAARGVLNISAVTSANGITEWVPLESMREIFGTEGAPL